LGHPTLRRTRLDSKHSGRRNKRLLDLALSHQLRFAQQSNNKCLFCVQIVCLFTSGTSFVGSHEAKASTKTPGSFAVVNDLELPFVRTVGF
jgi:hypothetical protein